MKPLLLLTLFLGTFIAYNANSQPAINKFNSNQNLEIDFNQTCEFNKNRFANIDLIKPGELVIIPVNSQISINFTTQPGDCIWSIVKQCKNLLGINTLVNQTKAAPSADTLSAISNKNYLPETEAVDQKCCQADDLLKNILLIVLIIINLLVLVQIVLTHRLSKEISKRMFKK